MSDMRVSVGQLGLAGAMTLAAGSAAYGTIIVVTPPANLPALPPPGTSGPLNWDINGDTVNDFNFTFRNPQSTTQVHWQANMNTQAAGSPNGVVGYTGPFVQYANNLSAGQVIGPASTFRPTSGTQVILGSLYGPGAGLFYGGFGPGTPNPGGGGPGAERGFAGFRFTIGGQTRYGWLDLRVSPSGIEFFGAAYEDSGASIPAGAVPAPGALAGLALGAVAMLGRKRREKIA